VLRTTCTHFLEKVIDSEDDYAQRGRTGPIKADLSDIQQFLETASDYVLKQGGSV
jgi:hypothetical protein